MAQKRFDILFDGSLVKGFDAVDVRANLKSLFNLDDKTLDQLFSGKPIAIKRDLGRQEAAKYQTALTKAGAKIQLSLNRQAESVSAPTPAATATATATATAIKPGSEPKTGANALDLKPAGSDLLDNHEKQTVETAEVDCSHIEMATGNAPLVTSGDEPAPIAIDPFFSLAEPGTNLGDSSGEEAIPVTAQDIDYLDIDPLGVNLALEKTENDDLPFKPQIDSLTLAEAGSDILAPGDRTNYEAREIDTSRLMLIEDD